MPKTLEKLKLISNFKLSETALKQLDEFAPKHLTFRARIELAIDMAWKLHKDQEKWFNSKKST